jgi:hypothetical protein
MAGFVYGFRSQLAHFSTSTHTHDFSNHSDGYGHSKTAFVWSSADHRESNSSIGLTSTRFRTTVRFMTFKLAIKII